MDDSNLENRIRLPDFFVLRTPLLPFDELLSWSASAESSVLNSDEAERRETGAGRAQLRSHLKSLIEREGIREALFIASPDLEESIPRWLRDPVSKSGQRTERALVRYFARMAGRATPFGLFSGCSLGSVGEHTQLAISAMAEYQRHTRLDMDYVHALAESFERDPQLRRESMYRPNSSLYRAAGQIRYVECRLENEVRSYHLVAVEPSSYLDLILDCAQEGARPPALAAMLTASDSEISLAEAEAFIDEVIEAQILVSDLHPPVTGMDATEALASKLMAASGNAKKGERLRHIQSRLHALDKQGIGVLPEQYREIAGLLDDFAAKPNLARLFQVDMLKPSPMATLGTGPLREITRGVEVLRRLTPPLAQDQLKTFRSAFVARYGEGRQIPLVQALDDEFGIGFGRSHTEISDMAPLLDGIVFADGEIPDTIALTKRDRYLLQLLTTALAGGEKTITLDEKDLDELAVKNVPPLPKAFAVMATLASASEVGLQRGDFQVVINNIGGPSGARLLGRFCYADQALRAKVQAHLRAEEQLEPEAVLAEIVHLPEGRLGNILSRPVLRTFEIPYLGVSGAPTERQLPITDLLVTVVDDRIVLTSIKLAREIRPRLTSAHNFSRRSLGIYSFLCSLQAQEVTSAPGWSWGGLSGASFLPRVQYGHLVLARARWNLTKKELQSLIKAAERNGFKAILEWANQRGLPKFALLADADNELTIDFRNMLSVETFLELVRAREGAALVEMYPGPEQLCAHGPEGRFIHELIVSFVSPHESSRRAKSVLPTAAERRVFSPGSEWTYVKLYGGSAVADQVLCKLVRPVTDEAIRSGAADQWFFIRYADPNWHLRLRIHGDCELLRSNIWPKVFGAAQTLIDVGHLWQVELSTYVRELERYGGSHGIECTERLFHADSEAVLAIIETLSGDEAANARWQLALCGIDMLLSDFQLDLNTKKTILSNMRAAFAREFHLDLAVKRQLGDKYRKERAIIEALLDEIRHGEVDDSPLAPGYSALRLRSSALAPIIAEFRFLDEKSLLSVSLIDLIPSLIHMHVNRMLRSAHRQQEFVLYDLMTRTYESRAHRTRGRARAT